jgi:predicted nuclease of predicted toxin-antitoxin system
MKFIVDAHLPRALVQLLNDRGHDAIHTRDLPTGNATKDDEINTISVTEERIVVSKDGDFYNSYTAKKEPFKLLHITTGNISNKDLLALIEANIDLIVTSLSEGSVVSIDRQYVIVIQ